MYEGPRQATVKITGLSDSTLIVHSENTIRVSKPTDRVNLGSTGKPRRTQNSGKTRLLKAIEALMHKGANSGIARQDLGLQDGSRGTMK